MKRVYIYTGVMSLLSVLAVSLALTVHSRNGFEEKWKREAENVKAYGKLLSGSEGRNGVFRLTVEQLKHSRDSVFKALDSTRKELGIRDSRLKGMQHISSSFSRTDTILLKDTVFMDSMADVDTLIHDGWYSVEVGMKYPSTVTVRPEFKSEKHIIVSASRETVNPPKRFFLFRWLQRKHTVLNVDVVEKNPYVQNQRSRFVETVR